MRARLASARTWSWPSRCRSAVDQQTRTPRRRACGARARPGARPSRRAITTSPSSAPRLRCGALEQREREHVGGPSLAAVARFSGISPSVAMATSAQVETDRAQHARRRAAAAGAGAAAKRRGRPDPERDGQRATSSPRPVRAPASARPRARRRRRSAAPAGGARCPGSPNSTIAEALRRRGGSARLDEARRDSLRARSTCVTSPVTTLFESEPSA